MKFQTKLFVSSVMLSLSLALCSSAAVAGNGNDANTGKVDICHRTASTSNPWVLINVSTSAEQAHYDHGDPVEFTTLGHKCVPQTTPQPLPTVTFSLAASQIFTGTSTTATWSSTNATSCSLYNGSTTAPVALFGTAVQLATFNTAGALTLSVQCSGPGGSATATAPLNVVQSLPPVELTACSVLTGTTSVYRWAVDYFPSTGAFDGTAASGGASIQGTISYTGDSDILVPGKTITFTTDEIAGESTVGVPSIAVGPSGVGEREAFFSVKLTTTLSNGTTIVGSSGLYFSKTNNCFVPQPL
jgi:hypothetical protein